MSVMGEEDGYEDEMLGKFGFKQNVVLDMQLPSGEKEVAVDYKMQFIDRNSIGKSIDDNIMDEEGHSKYIPQDLSEATSDYECTLSDVISYLKRCGYPLENCFIAFFSPVFSAYINCGLDPLPNSIKITSEDLMLIQN